MSTLNERIAALKGWHEWRDWPTSDYNGPTPMFARYYEDAITFYGDRETPVRDIDWSGSIEDAWHLVGELTAAGWLVEISVTDASTIVCAASHWDDEDPRVVNERDESTPAAICAAYLKVMEQQP